MAGTRRPARALQLRISLQDIEPEIWRVLLVRESSSLARLHGAIQRAMGWTNSHLYDFEIAGRRYTDLDTWEAFDGDIEPGDAAATRLGALHLSPGSRLLYLYDFGDDWRHDIVVEAIVPIRPGERLPRCIAGARACPPEDCGGPPGYFELLEALHDPTHPEHESFRTWVGGAFDPEAFEAPHDPRRVPDRDPRADPAAGHASPGMEIRPFQAADTRAVVALWERCDLLRPWNDPHRDIARKLEVRPDLFLVGVVDGSIAATVMAGYDGHRGWINYLAVAPEERRRGRGRAMMAEAESRLRAAGCPKINLQIRSENEAVIAFYAALGYVRDEVVSMGRRLVADDQNS